MAAKQEVTAEEELTVKTQARAPSAGVVLQRIIIQVHSVAADEI